MTSEIILFGGGGHGKVVMDAAVRAGSQVAAVIDHNGDGELYGVKKYREIPGDLIHLPCVVSIGDNMTRKKLAAALTQSFGRIIDPSAIVSAHAVVAEGSMVLHGSVVQAGARIGRHVIINTKAQVDHDCLVSDYVHLAPGSVLCGNVQIGIGTLVGAGAMIKPGIKIGAWVTIGVGAVVVRDLPDFAIAAGNPARIIRFAHK